MYIEVIDLETNADALVVLTIILARTMSPMIMPVILIALSVLSGHREQKLSQVLE